MNTYKGLKVPAITFLLIGYLYFGKYVGSEYYDLEYRPIKYHAGIYLEFKPTDNTSLFVDNKTFIEDSSGTGFNPSQNNYELGVSYKMDNVDVILSHKCLHPVDGRSNGAAAQDYTLIETRFNF